MIKKLIGLCLVVGLLAGCETVKVATAPVPKATLEQGAYDAKIAFLGYLKITNEYASWPRCGKPESPKLCSRQDVVDVLRKAAVMGNAATQAAEDAVRKLDSDPIIVEALVIGAKEAVKAFGVIANEAKKGSK